MPNSDQYDMNTELPYDEMTAAAFRVEIAKVAERGQEQFGALMNAPRSLTPAEKQLQLTAMHTANFGWSLVALIGWVEKTYGPEAGWKATAMAEDVMTNGGNSFCEDISLPGPLPPPAAGEAARVIRPAEPDPAEQIRQIRRLLVGQRGVGNLATLTAIQSVVWPDDGEAAPDPDHACAAHDDAHLGQPCPDRTVTRPNSGGATC